MVKNAFASNPQKNKGSSSRAFSSKFQGRSPKHDIHLQVILCLNRNSNRLPKTKQQKAEKWCFYGFPFKNEEFPGRC